MEINYIIEFALTAGFGVITFFLKRTIDELDNCKRKLKRTTLQKKIFFVNKAKTGENWTE